MLYEPVFSSPRVFELAEKKKIVETNVRARQSVLNNKPDSQDRYARAKLWSGSCISALLLQHALKRNSNAILIPFCFLYRSDFSIVRYTYKYTIARRKRSFVSEYVSLWWNMVKVRIFFFFFLLSIYLQSMQFCKNCGDVRFDFLTFRCYLFISFFNIRTSQQKIRTFVRSNYTWRALQGRTRECMRCAQVCSPS